VLLLLFFVRREPCGVAVVVVDAAMLYGERTSTAGQNVRQMRPLGYGSFSGENDQLTGDKGIED